MMSREANNSTLWGYYAYVLLVDYFHDTLVGSWSGNFQLDGYQQIPAAGTNAFFELKKKWKNRCSCKYIGSLNFVS